MRQRKESKKKINLLDSVVDSCDDLKDQHAVSAEIFALDVVNVLLVIDSPSDEAICDELEFC